MLGTLPRVGLLTCKMGMTQSSPDRALELLTAQAGPAAAPEVLSAHQLPVLLWWRLFAPEVSAMGAPLTTPFAEGVRDRRVPGPPLC